MTPLLFLLLVSHVGVLLVGLGLGYCWGFCAGTEEE